MRSEQLVASHDPQQHGIVALSEVGEPLAVHVEGCYAKCFPASAPMRHELVNNLAQSLALFDDVEGLAWSQVMLFLVELRKHFLVGVPAPLVVLKRGCCTRDLLPLGESAMFPEVERWSIVDLVGFLFLRCLLGLARP